MSDARHPARCVGLGHCSVTATTSFCNNRKVPSATHVGGRAEARASVACHSKRSAHAGDSPVRREDSILVAVPAGGSSRVASEDYDDPVLTLAFDRVVSAVVWLFSGKHNSDDDYAAYVDSIERLTGRAPAGVRSVGVLVVERGNAIPNAKWRRKIAEASKDVGSETSSPSSRSPPPCAA